MIQRIQSLYLLLLTFLSIFFQYGKMIIFHEEKGNTIILNIGGIFMSSMENNISLLERLLPLNIILISIPAISLVTFFLYKNRKLQIKFALALIFLIVILIMALLYISFYITGKYNADFIPGVRPILPLLMLGCAFLAWRAIKKDEDLVKSYDRLR